MKRPVRVVYFDHVASLSGAEISLLRLLDALGDRVDATVLLGEDGPLVEALSLVGATVAVVPIPQRTRELRRDVAGARPGWRAVTDTARYTAAVASHLRVLRPDLVHTNSLKAAVYGLAAGRLTRTPVVWHVRDRIAEDYLPAPAVRAVRASARVGPSAVITNSRATLATLPGARRARVVPNAVPSPAELASPPVGPVRSVGVIGRLAPWKGQHVFLRAFARAFPEPSSTRAALIGGALFGEDDYERELQHLASSLGIEHRTDFLGHLDDPSQARARLDVVVHCSTIPEPFGQVVVEAMATGVPVVAAASGGPAEVITDGRDGLLAQPGDPAELAACLVRLADDLPLRQRLVKAGQRRALDFAPARAAAGVLACYDEVLRR